MRPHYLDVLERRVPGRDLLREVLRRAARRLLPAGDGAGRQVWTPADVIDVDGPELNLRSYLELRDIRSLLELVPPERRGTAVEVGCGYGRLVVVFQESFKRVIGVEREPGLLAIARELIPSAIEFVNPSRLDDLGGVAGPVDFAMIFTVLMHMTDEDARKVLESMKRLVGKGWILVVERTDAEKIGDTADSAAFMVHGRPLAVFEEWMLPFRLVKTLPRQVEPTNPAPHNGAYMLFANP